MRLALAVLVLLGFLGTAAGGAAGVLLGFGLARLLPVFVPGLPVETPTLFVVAAIGVSTLAGIGSGVLPARRAAELDPVDALRAE